MPAVKNVGAIIKVEICIRNALALYGHCEDHVRPAQPMSSPNYMFLIWFLHTPESWGAGEVIEDVLAHPILNTSVHHDLFQIACPVCTRNDRPKSTKKATPAANDGTYP